MRLRMSWRIVAAVVVAAAAAACSSSTSPSQGPMGGHSTTITASDNFGSNGNYFFNPSPDTAPAGNISWKFGTVTHNVHFDAGPFLADSIGATSGATVMRTLSTPGTYVYHCTIHNITGTLVLQ